MNTCKHPQSRNNCPSPYPSPLVGEGRSLRLATEVRGASYGCHEKKDPYPKIDIDSIQSPLSLDACLREAPPAGAKAGERAACR